MPTDPPVIHSKKATITVSGQGQDDWKVYLGSIESSHDVRRGGIRLSGNDAIGMNPPVTIGGNNPQRSGQRGFDIFDSVTGIYNFTNRRLIWNDEAISENSVRENVF